MLLLVLCFAHMVLLCVYNVFGGCRVMSTCKGGGVVDENGGMGGRQKVPVYSEYTTFTSEYTAVDSEVDGKSTSPILRLYFPIPQKV